MLVINMYGGPGTGKSTSAAMVFAMLKQRGINTEYVTEFAKDLTWHKRHSTLNDQVYVLAKQHHKLFMLKDQVDVVVTDSPLLLTLYYGQDHHDSLKQLAIDLYKGYNNIDILLRRSKEYNPSGRNQTEAEAREIDIQIKDILNTHATGYSIHDTNMDSYNRIANSIEVLLKWEANPDAR